MAKIMIDSGHTGSKWNAGAVKGYYESAVMWKLHNYLYDELAALGFSVGRTRKTIDTELDVTARGKMAKGYDCLISLHSNSADDSSVRRVVAIYQTSDSQGSWDTESKKLADELAAVVANTMGVTYKNYSRLAGGDRDGDGKKDDNYYGVLHGSRMVGKPAIILEHSFHSNAETCKWLMNDANLRKLAKAEAACLAKHYGVDTKPVEKEELYQVRVKVNDLRIRKGPGTGYSVAGFIKPGDYGITEESKGKGAALWGHLASGAGWIALDYTEKLGAITVGSKVEIKGSVDTYYPGGKIIPDWAKDDYYHVVTKETSNGKKVVKGGKTCVLLGKMIKKNGGDTLAGINTWVALDNLKLV